MLLRICEALGLVRRQRGQTPVARIPRIGWPLDAPIVQLTPWDCLTTRDLCEGMFVLGNPGSGKTSTLGQILPLAALNDFWGILALTTKPDDAAMWMRLVKKSGRGGQLRVIRPGGDHYFNIVRYELERERGGNTLRLASMLMEMFREGQPATHSSDTERFFEQQGQILLCNAIDALRLAREVVSFETIKRLIDSAPMRPENVDDPQWQTSYCCEVLAKARENARTPAEQRFLDVVGNYWLVSFPNSNERSRGDTLATIESGLFQLSRDPFRDLLDSPNGCSFLPDCLSDGGVILVDCPVGVHGVVGKMLTIAFKRLCKEYLRRRPVFGDATRPVLFMSDECQCYCTREDAEWFQVARSQKIANFYLTQSTDNLVVALGTPAHFESLAGGLTTHVYFCCSGHTAQWIEQRIAAAWRSMESVSIPSWSAGQKQSPSISIAEHPHPQVLASDLARLRTGGPVNGGLVDCLILKPGRRFVASGLPFARLQFAQND